MDLVVAQQHSWKFPPNSAGVTKVDIPVALNNANPDQPNPFILQTPPESNSPDSNNGTSPASSSGAKEPLKVDTWPGFSFGRHDSLISAPCKSDKAVASDNEANKSNKSPVREYDLRPGPREDPDNVWTAWLDKDDSGNYDPNAKFEKPQAVKRTRDVERAIRTSEALEGGPKKRAKVVSPLVARQEGHSFIVAMSLKSTQAREQLKKYQGQDNWPDEPWNKLALPDPDRTGTNEHSGVGEEPGVYKLRSRYNTDPLFRTFHESSPIEEDLTGHPAARGCVACYKLGETCPMLKNPLEYPCGLCKDDGCDCELITPPKWKRKCELCRKKKIQCSYCYKPHDEEEHEFPCLECSEAGHFCIAGPRVDDPTDPPIRVDLDFDWNNYRHPALKNSEKERPFIACTLCRKNKKRCSLRPRDKPPCRACREMGLNCTFEALDSSKQSAARPDASIGRCTATDAAATPSKKSSKQPQAPTDIFMPGAPIPHWSMIHEDTGSSSSPLVIDSLTQPGSPEPSDRISSDGTFIVNTAFAHPLRFNYDPNGEHLGPCHFCAIPRYGLFGLGFQRVVVVEWEPGTGYDEIADGHKDGGEEPSRMCTTCTFARVRICSCDRHEIQPLPSHILTPEKLDQETAYDAVLKSPLDGLKQVDYTWCSICPTLARYECVAPQEINAQGEAIPPKAKAELGCGLYLCDACAMALTAKEGKLQEMLSEGPEAQFEGVGEDEHRQDGDMDVEAKKKDGIWPMGWRADAEFLKQDGLMMQAVLLDL